MPPPPDFKLTIVQWGPYGDLINPTNWSNWQQLSHVLAWVLRFVNNVRTDRESCQIGPLNYS